MHKYPNVSIKAIIRANDTVCVLLHKDGNYDFPGGQMEWGESPEEALKRELKEELAYKLHKDPEFIDIWNYISNDKSRHSMFLYYLVKLKQRPELTTAEEEAEAGTKVVWLTKHNLSRYIQNPSFLEKIFA